MNTSDQTSNHIVIIGGGFAGVEAAISLRKKKYEVTLVSNRDYFFIYPISIWIPVAKMKFDDATISLHNMSKKYGFHLIVDQLEQVNPERKEVVLKTQTLSFDYLILANGAGKMKHKGLENTYSICGSPEQSMLIQTQLNSLIEKGSGKIAVGFGGNPKDKSAVRGGPAFELMFNIINKLKSEGVYKNFNISFFAPMESPGKRMGKSGLKMLDSMLKSEKIEARVGKKITEFVTDGVLFEDGSKLESDLTLFIPATNGSEALQSSNLPKNEAGFIRIDDNCLVEGHETIYAIGDVAAIPEYEWSAKQGHTAVVMARNAAFNIHQEINGLPLRKGYEKHLNILCIMDTGRSAAIVYRKGSFDFVLPLPVVGHWLKKAWGWHYKLTH